MDFGPYTVLRLVAECGDDMTKWPTAKHFTSWLSLAPGNKISGGRVLSCRDSSILQSRGRAAAHRGRQHRTDTDGARRVLPPPGRPHRQGEGRHRHRAQARGSVLQRAPLRHDVRRPWRVVLRRALPAASGRQSPSAREEPRIHAGRRWPVPEEFLRKVAELLGIPLKPFEDDAIA